MDFAKLLLYTEALLVRAELREQLTGVLRAVKEAHEQHGDDLCWMPADVNRIFAACGLPPQDLRVGDTAAMLKNCERYVGCLQSGGPWKSYAELEQENEQLRASADTTLTTLRGVQAIVDSLATRVAAQSELLSKRAEKPT